MSAIPDRSKSLESGISICLLFVLFLVAAGIFCRQFDADMSRFGMGVIGPQAKAAPELGSLTVRGFEALAETQVYTAENLFEKIDGKAPLYLESGFKQLFTQRFVSTGDESLWAELFLYDMCTIRNAFSVYSAQKRADVEDLPGLGFAYKTSNALFFVHGEYYIELIGSSESAELTEAMTDIANKIRTNLPIDDNTRIAELDLLPRENIIAGSIKLSLKNTFGFEGLTDIFSASYEVDGDIIIAFIGRRPDSDDAQVTAESYRRFLMANGAAVKTATKKPLEGKVLDFYGTTEIVLATGPFVAGIHEAENQRSAEKLAAMLIDKLSQEVNDR